MTLGPQFYPREEWISSLVSVSRDTPLYHGTSSTIEGGVIKPAERTYWGEGAYSTESLHSAKNYARDRAKAQGRLFGTVYEVEPVSEKATVAGSEAGKGIVVDPEGMKTKRVVDYPLVHDYSDEHAKAKAKAEQEKTQIDSILRFFE